MTTVAPSPAPTVLVTAVGVAEGSRPAAAALACAGADPDRATLLVDVGGRPPRPTLLASVAARRLEERLAAHLPGARVAARGQVCHLAVGADSEGLEMASAATAVAREELSVVHLAPPLLRPLLADAGSPRCSGAMLRADLAADRALLALLAADLLASGLAVSVLKQRLPWVIERRALFGALPPDSGGGLPAPVLRKLLPRRCAPSTPSTPAVARASTT